MALFSPKTVQTPLSPIEAPRRDLRSTGLKNTVVNMTDEEANEICKKHLEGCTLSFYPYSTNLAVKRDKMAFATIIEPYIIEGNVYKIVKVTKLQNEEASEEDIEKKVLKRTTFLHKKMKKNLKVIDISTELAFNKIEESNIDIPDERSSNQMDGEEQKDQEPSSTNKNGVQTLSHELSQKIDSPEKKNDVLQNIEVHNEIQNVQIKQSVMGSSNKSYSNMHLKLIRNLNDLFNTKKPRAFTKFSIYISYIIMVAILILVFINYSVTQKSLNGMQDSMTVSSIASGRLNRAIIAWEWMLMFYARLLNLRPLYSVYGYSRKYIYNQTQAMRGLNNKLWTKINQLDNQDIVDTFLQNNIQYYDANGKEIFSNSNLNIFGATDILILQNSYIGTFSGLDAVLVKRPEFITTTNNTANGYLVACETQIKRLYDLSRSITQDSINQSETILIVEFLILFLLCVVLFLTARGIIQTYSKISRAIIMINDKSIKERIILIRTFERFLNEGVFDSNSGTAVLDLYLSNRGDKTPHQDPAKHKVHQFKKRFTIRSLGLQLMSYVLISVLCVLLSLAFFIVLFHQAKFSFTTLANINRQVYIINNVKYQNALFVGNFYYCAIFQSNASMLIREQDPRNQLDTNLDVLSHINDQLLVAFPNSEDGLQDPTISEVLHGNICNVIDPNLS